MTRLDHVLAGALVAIPAVALLLGRGPAFTMYASTVWFRIDVIAEDAQGRVYPIAPTDLADQVTPSAAPYLSGADHFRRTYDVGPLRHHLEDVARLGCARQRGRARVVSITLVERTYGSDAPRETHARAACTT